MKTKELKNRVKIQQVGYGKWKIIDLKTGNYGYSNDSEAIDRLRYNISPRMKVHEYTYRQALKALFDKTLQ